MRNAMQMWKNTEVGFSFTFKISLWQWLLASDSRIYRFYDKKVVSFNCGASSYTFHYQTLCPNRYIIKKEKNENIKNYIQYTYIIYIYIYIYISYIIYIIYITDLGMTRGQ